MEKAKISAAFLVFSCLLGTYIVDCQSLIKVMDIKETLWNFGEMRSYRQEDGKAKIRDYLRGVFNELATNFNTVLEEHYFEWNYQDMDVNGTNFIWILPGTKYGQPDDKFMCVGAHYDSQVNTHGVNDDGSGMTAMIETARALVKHSADGCELINSVGFVAFDWEEIRLQGSVHFLQEYFVPKVLDRMGISQEQFGGIVVLDTIMNWNNTPNSQLIPLGFDRLFPEQYAEVAENDHRGDFMVVTNRIDDADIGRGVTDMWKQMPEADKFRVQYLEMQVSGRPESWPVRWLAFKDLTRSDHQSFWRYIDRPRNFTDEYREGLKAIFITDTANFRGTMVQCYHNPCDDLDGVTDGSLQYLAKITETLTRYFLEISTEKLHAECVGPADHWNFPGVSPSPSPEPSIATGNRLSAFGILLSITGSFALRIHGN